MRLSPIFRTLFVCALTLEMFSAHAQQPAPPAAPSTGTSTPQPASIAPQTPPPAPEPALIEDGGISLELDYWLARDTPTTRGSSGSFDTYVSDLKFPGDSKYAASGTLSFPGGKQNSLRFSYFRVQGKGETTLSQPLTLYNVDYAAGDELNNDYLIQGAKISWDYLSYTFHNPGHFNRVRFKTLYELQLLNISSNSDSPNEEAIVNAGDTAFLSQGSFLASGSKRVFMPTFGGELEKEVGKNFRWELLASGFGLPHHGTIWDAQADIALRLGKVEAMIGYRAYHFETSSSGADQYYKETLSGAYVGLRYYLLRPPAQ
jgi:hypothetical protein